MVYTAIKSDHRYVCRNIRFEEDDSVIGIFLNVGLFYEHP